MPLKCTLWLDFLFILHTHIPHHDISYISFYWYIVSRFSTVAANGFDSIFPRFLNIFQYQCCYIFVWPWNKFFGCQFVVCVCASLRCVLFLSESQIGESMCNVNMSVVCRGLYLIWYYKFVSLSSFFSTKLYSLRVMSPRNGCVCLFALPSANNSSDHGSRIRCFIRNNAIMNRTSLRYGTHFSVKKKCSCWVLFFYVRLDQH